MLDQETCLLALITDKNAHLPIPAYRNTYAFNIAGHEKGERNSQVGKTVSSHTLVEVVASEKGTWSESPTEP